MWPHRSFNHRSGPSKRESRAGSECVRSDLLRIRCTVGLRYGAWYSFISGGCVAAGTANSVVCIQGQVRGFLGRRSRFRIWNVAVSACASVAPEWGHCVGKCMRCSWFVMSCMLHPVVGRRSADSFRSRERVSVAYWLARGREGQCDPIPMVA